MKITTIGRGNFGGTLAGLWRSAGHDVTELGHDGGDTAGSDVVLLAVPYAAMADALASVTGVDDQVIIDATNRLQGESPPAGFASNAEYVKANTNGPVAKAFNLNFGKLLQQASTVSTRPHSIWTGDEGAREAIEQLTRDIGLVAVNGGPLEHAALQEEFAKTLMAIVKDVGEGLLFYRFAAPENF